MALQRNAHLAQAIVYVFLNPVRAGIVDRPEDWPWSSFGATVGLRPPPVFLQIASVLELIDPRPDVARKLLDAIS